MDIKKSLKDVLVLFLICVIFGAALAATNMLTADTIAEKRYQQKLEAYYAVMPDDAVFDESSDVDITKYAGLPATVKGAKKENNGLGYAIEVETKGYGSGMVIIVGVSPDGIIYGATCSQSNETNGVEKSYGDNFKNLDMEGVGGVDLIAGSTMTTNAYRNAVVDAINAATIIGGGRTEEQKYNDAINEALPAGNGEFTKVVLLAAVEGIDAIYEATNGEGYVCVIGTNSKGVFIGVDKDGNVVGNHTDEHKALAEAAIASVKANVTVDVDLSQYADNAVIRDRVNYVKKTATGTYMIEIKTTGNWDKNNPIVLLVIIDANKQIVNIQTVSYGADETPGDVQLQDGAFNTSFIGKNDVEAGAVDTVAGVTYTTTAYKNAVLDAFNVYTLLQGGDVDFRTEEEKFQDALEAALPEGGEEFEKVVLLSAIEGIDSVYEATNGAGYVCVIGTDSTGVFIGVNAEGVAVGEVSAEHKALAEAAIASIKANEAVDVDLSEYADNTLIANSVNSVKKTGTGTYMIEIKTTGNYDKDNPIVLLIVIDANKQIVNIQTVSYGANETPGDAQLQDGKFNTSFIGKDETAAGDVDTVAGVTYTTTAYKNAVLNAFSVVKILEGEDVDTRTEEEKFRDALEAALPEANGEFTKYFRVEVIEGVDFIYKATNGAGYVCVIGTDSTGVFIGVNAEGVVVNEVEAEHKLIAETAIAKVMATEITDVDVSMYNQSGVATDIRRIFRAINYVQKTSTGNYIIEIKCDGHGWKGDPSHEQASGERYVIKVCISSDGVIIDSQTISHSETSTWGGPQLEDGAYNSNFIGKNETEAGGVDTVAGTTNTTGGYKEAILRCFTAITIIEGGAN